MKTAGVGAMCSVGLALTVATSGAGADPASSLSLKAADAMIARCVSHAGEKHFPPLSIAVIDLTGTLIAFVRQDGASPVTGDAALLKARTVVRARLPTSAFGAVLARDAATRDAFLVLGLTSIPGGVPVRQAGQDVIGAIGVSGGSDQQDEACALQASTTASDPRS